VQSLPNICEDSGVVFCEKPKKNREEAASQSFCGAALRALAPGDRRCGMKRLERYTIRGSQRLRKGYTTGCCAAGAAKAAAEILLGGESISAVMLTAPAGIALEVESASYGGDCVSCAVRKDAGDDPDVTDGMLIFATVTRTPSGIQIEGGKGIGRATRKGLSVRVGHAAINPVPMRMIREALEQTAQKHAYAGGLRVVISAPDGEEVAERTFNSRLGIIGGISILGTTGIVEPMSEAALVASIRAEMDTRYAENSKAVLLVPGSYGRDFAFGRFGIDLDMGVKCSNFIGEALDYAVYRGFAHIVLMGHVGKLVKLAGGIMNTHSSIADARMEILACHCALCGLSSERVTQVFGCITVDEADALLREWGVHRQVWGSVAERVRFQLEYRLAGKAGGAFAAFSANGIVMSSDHLDAYIDMLKQKRGFEQ